MTTIWTYLANKITRTRKTISPDNLASLRQRISVTRVRGDYQETYPNDPNIDPHRKLKEIARYLLISQHAHRKRVLDIGSGSFYGVALIAENARRVVGIESSRAAVKMAKSFWGKTINIECLQGKDLSEVRESFQMITIINVIEHMPEKDALTLLQAAAGKLEKGGRLFLSTPRNRSQVRSGQLENPDHVKEYNDESLEDLVRKADFKIEKKYIQTMTKIKTGIESEVDPTERAWLFWLLVKMD